MKKIIAILFIMIFIVLSVTACSTNTEKPQTKKHYDHFQLQVLHDEILRAIRKVGHVPINTYGINETKGCIELSVYKHKVNNWQSRKSLWFLQEKYGDVLVVDFWGPEQRIELANLDSQKENSTTFAPPLMVMFGVVFIAFAGLYFALRNASLQLMTNTNKIVSKSSHLTSKQVENLVKESMIPVPNDLEEKILDEIEWDRVSH